MFASRWMHGGCSSTKREAFWFLCSNSVKFHKISSATRSRFPFRSLIRLHFHALNSCSSSPANRRCRPGVALIGASRSLCRQHDRPRRPPKKHARVLASAPSQEHPSRRSFRHAHCRFRPRGLGISQVQRRLKEAVPSSAPNRGRGTLVRARRPLHKDTTAAPPRWFVATNSQSAPHLQLSGSRRRPAPTGIRGSPLAVAVRALGLSGKTPGPCLLFPGGRPSPISRPFHGAQRSSASGAPPEAAGRCLRRGAPKPS